MILITRLISHQRDQEQIDKLADQEKPTGQEPDESGDPFPIVETMDAATSDEAQEPK